MKEFKDLEFEITLFTESVVTASGLTDKTEDGDNDLNIVF